MAGILISPRVEQKILGKRAAWKLKDGNPKFKDILRQRCRLRIKERRALFVAQARGLDSCDIDGKSLASIVQQEYQKFVKEIETDFVPDEWDEERSLSGENFPEEDERLMKQFDALFQSDTLEKLLEEADCVICPLCLHGQLYEIPTENNIRCQNCLSRVSGCSKLSEVKLQISHCLDAHLSSGCLSTVSFSVNPGDEIPCLFCFCSDCSYFDIVG